MDVCCVLGLAVRKRHEIRVGDLVFVSCFDVPEKPVRTKIGPKEVPQGSLRRFEAGCAG